MTRKKNPFHPLFDQVAEVMNAFYEGRKRGYKENLPDDIEQQIENLKRGVSILKETYEKALEDAGIDELNVIKEISQHPDQVDDSTKRLLKRAAALKREATAIRNVFQKAQNSSVTKTKKGRRRIQKEGLRTKRGWKKL
ncbi:MAG: hypothetical protein Tsb0021_15020 [Chlamydiales bacterium]